MNPLQRFEIFVLQFTVYLFHIFLRQLPYSLLFFFFNLDIVNFHQCYATYGKKFHFCSHFVKTNLILLYNMYLFFFQLNVTFYLGATSWGGGGGSELLPGGWNATPEVYTLNYKNDKVRFLFTLG